MKKILILVNGLYLGGFSKSLINLLLCLQNDNTLKIDLYSFDKENLLLKNEIPNNVNIIIPDNLEYSNSFLYKFLLFMNKTRYVFFEKLYKTLFSKQIPRKHLIYYSQKNQIIKAKSLKNDFSFANKYDSVISWEEGFCDYILTYKVKNNNKIGYIHPNYKEVGLNKKLDKAFVKSMKYIVTISKSCYETLCDVFPHSKQKIKYVPNRMNYSYLINKSKAYIIDKPTNYTLCTACRIVDYDKAIFRIVDLSKKLRDNGLNFSWWVIGEGSDYDIFIKKISEENLENIIIPLGGMVNPYPYILTSDLFVMQSHREGRPVAVDEAILLRKPVLITNYSSAEEQVNNGINGFIVNDDFDAIYDKLYDLIGNNFKLNQEVNITEKIKCFEDCNSFKALL